MPLRRLVVGVAVCGAYRCGIRNRNRLRPHRREVRAAVLDTTAALVGEHGLRSVTMSQIAERTGIGRATLYKYFPDVDTILHAWHEREITGHLSRLTEIRDRAGDADQRLAAVLAAYAEIAHRTRRHHDAELVSFLHRDSRLASAQQQLHGLVADLLAEGARAGTLRDDVAPDELASYCLHALNAASNLSAGAAVRRLVAVTLTGLRHTGPGGEISAPRAVPEPD